MVILSDLCNAIKKTFGKISLHRHFKYFDWKQWTVRHLGLILNLINYGFDYITTGISIGNHALASTIRD